MLCRGLDGEKLEWEVEAGRVGCCEADVSWRASGIASAGDSDDGSGLRRWNELVRRPLGCCGVGATTVLGLWSFRAGFTVINECIFNLLMVFNS